MGAVALRGLVAAILLGTAVAEPGDARQAPATELRLRPGDALRLEVKDEPALSGQFQLGETGAVMLPLVGLVQVSGRALAEMIEELAAVYAVELRDPVFQVTPVFRVAVLGDVQRPGLLPVDPTYTLTDVLAAAGGLSPLADPTNISLVRDGEVILARLDPGAAALAGTLRSGDHIIVGRRGWVQQHMPILVGAAASVAAAAVTSLIIR